MRRKPRQPPNHDSNISKQRGGDALPYDHSKEDEIRAQRSPQAPPAAAGGSGPHVHNIRQAPVIDQNSEAQQEIDVDASEEVLHIYRASDTGSESASGQDAGEAAEEDSKPGEKRRPRITVSKANESVEQEQTITFHNGASDPSTSAGQDLHPIQQAVTESSSHSDIAPSFLTEGADEATTVEQPSSSDSVSESIERTESEQQSEQDSTNGIRRRMTSWFSRGDSPPADPPPDPEPVETAAVDPPAKPQSEEFAPEESPPELDATEPAVFSMPRLRFGESAWDAQEPWWSLKNWTKLPLSGAPDDLIIRNGTYAGIAAIGGSVRGTMHRPRAELNDDAFTIHGVEQPGNEEPMYLVAVIADGVGSSEYSSFSSRIYVEAAARWISHKLKALGSCALDRLHDEFATPESKFLIDVADRVRVAYKDPVPQWVREHPNIPPPDTEDKEVQCTLTFAVVDLQTNTDNNVLIGAIGDSPVMQISHGDLDVLHPSVSESQEIYSTATQVAIGATSLELVRATLRPTQPLLLMTDGVGNFLQFRGTTALGKFIASTWHSPIDHFQFIRDISFDIRGADDDRTMIVLWARETE